MIVFVERRVVEAEAMQRSAAAAHGVLFEISPAGCGLAGIADDGVRSADRLDVHGGGGGDAAEMAEEVEEAALGGEEGGERRAEDAQGIAGAAGVAVAR